MVISHDVGLLEATVNRVFHLDATRGVIDVYNIGWKAYLAQRETDERRRRRERANTEKQAAVLSAQADRMRAKATKAKAAQSMLKRAEKMLAGLEDVRQADKVAKLRFPEPAPCGKTPLRAQRTVEVLRLARGFHRCRPRDRPGQPGRRAGPERRRQDDAAPGARGRRDPRHRRGRAGPRAADRLLRAGARDARPRPHGAGKRAFRRAEHCRSPELRRVLGAFLFSGDTVEQPAGTLSGGEKTRLALAILVCSSANVLLLDEPTNNLDPASRDEVLRALRTYQGAVVLVTHDEGAVEALSPEKVLLLPDGVEDNWSDDLADLIALA